MDVDEAQHWDSRGHFFAAAAEAMRRILVDSARRKRADEARGRPVRVELTDGDLARPTTPDEIVALDDSLCRLAEDDAASAEIVKLRLVRRHVRATKRPRFLGISRSDRLPALGLRPSLAWSPNGAG